MNRPSREQKSAPAFEPGLVSLKYRSHAVQPMSTEALRTLEHEADSRNRAEGLTGVMIYDDGHFFQWLEGPERSVARVWDSVQRDRRHEDLRVSSSGPTSARVFGDFGMKVLHRADPLWSAAALLANTLPQLVEAVVVPAIATRHQQTSSMPAPEPRADELAKLLIKTDPTAALVLARELSSRAGPLSVSRASLFDPTARSLGDLWYRDDASGLEVDLGLTRLQGIVRELADVSAPTGLLPFAVLVAPQPGEPHVLGAAIDAQLLLEAGWETQAEFPPNDAALQALVADGWFDALDLSLSTALRREDEVAKLEKTIATARVASKNPALVVVVGGRVFSEGEDLSAAIGADVNASRVQRLGASIEVALRRPRSTERRRESEQSIAKRLGTT